MIGWVRRLAAMFRRSEAPGVPENREQRELLQRADAVLENPRIQRLLSQRGREMRASFRRADGRLSR